MTMPYSDALDMHDQMREYWQGVSVLPELAYLTVQSELTSTTKQADAALQLRNVVATTISLAETFFVTEPICRLLEDGQRDFPADAKLVERDVPVDSGFVYFERPISILRPLSDGEFTESIKLMAWTKIKDGILVLFFRDSPRMGEFPYFVGGGMWEYGESPDDVVQDMITHQSSSDGVNREFPSRTPLFRLGLGFLIFSQQRIVIAKAETPYRALRRRVEKWCSKPFVQVIQLRRQIIVKNEGNADDSAEWSCQWLVRGHWRNQPCGPGRTEHRPTFISSYVKGPEDKPFKTPKATIFAVKR